VRRRGFRMGGIRYWHMGSVDMRMLLLSQVAVALTSTPYSHSLRFLERLLCSHPLSGEQKYRDLTLSPASVKREQKEATEFHHRKTLLFALSLSLISAM
jgi:hypothetical protein